MRRSWRPARLWRLLGRMGHTGERYAVRPRWMGAVPLGFVSCRRLLLKVCGGPGRERIPKAAKGRTELLREELQEVSDRIKEALEDDDEAHEKEGQKVE